MARLHEYQGKALLKQRGIHVLDGMKAAGRRMSGFGHRIHTADPRTARLFELAEAADARSLD